MNSYPAGADACGISVLSTLFPVVGPLSAFGVYLEPRPPQKKRLEGHWQNRRYYSGIRIQGILISDSELLACRFGQIGDAGKCLGAVLAESASAEAHSNGRASSSKRKAASNCRTPRRLAPLATHASAHSTSNKQYQVISRPDQDG
jgi:hypothetical protein